MTVKRNGYTVTCPECGGTNIERVEVDGGLQCNDCQTETYESWFWLGGNELRCLACGLVYEYTTDPPLCPGCRSTNHEG